MATDDPGSPRGPGILRCLGLQDWERRYVYPDTFIGVSALLGTAISPLLKIVRSVFTMRPVDEVIKSQKGNAMNDSQNTQKPQVYGRKRVRSVRYLDYQDRNTTIMTVLAELTRLVKLTR